MDQDVVSLTILGMAAVTLALKAVPLVALARRSLPPVVHDLLRHLPIAVLSAMTVQLVAVKDGAPFLAFDNIALIAAIPTVIVGVVSRNLFLTIAFGVGFLAAMRAFST